MKLHAVEIQKLPAELYQAFATRDALLTAGDRTVCNTMTIGWCQLGRIWRKQVCCVYVRPERHTYQFMEDHDSFTVSVLPESAKETLAFCGSKSGRDVDKIQSCGLTLCYGAGDAPFFEEAEMTLVCRKLYAHNMTEAGVLEPDVVLPYYGAKGGWHRAYIGEIVEAYIR